MLSRPSGTGRCSTAAIELTWTGAPITPPPPGTLVLSAALNGSADSTKSAEPARKS